MYHVVSWHVSWHEVVIATRTCACTRVPYKNAVYLFNVPIVSGHDSSNRSECGVGGDIGAGCCENLKPKALTRIRSEMDGCTGFRGEEQQLSVARFTLIHGRWRKESMPVVGRVCRNMVAAWQELRSFL
jgi:hypothetical protein